MSSVERGGGGIENVIKKYSYLPPYLMKLKRKCTLFILAKKNLLPRKNIIS